MNKWLVIVLMTLCLGCKEDGMPPDPKPPLTDYLVFGHLGSFCMNCDVLYKIENESLYTTGKVAHVDPTHPSFTLLPLSQYQLVKDLPSEFPSQLLNEKAESIGSYFPDVGATYIEVKQNGTVHHWYIQAGSTPSYLVEFIKQVTTAETELN